MLNFATPLFASLEPYLPAGISCVGGGFLADMMLSECYQIVNNQVFTQHVIAILISGDCVIESTILHGCFPCSDYLTITKSEGPVVLEIDGMPAIQKIQELLGGPDVIDVKDFAMNVTLGVNRGEKFGDFKENEFANRLTLAVDEELKALIMFEPDLVVGTEVQLMRRNLESDYVGKAIEEKMRKIGHLQPIFSFYINCGGRARPFAGVDFEDAEVVRQALGTIPFSGFYSGVEVAHVGGVLQPLDWTGVSCFLAEK
jgi:small ligand-binding sensory domain FIST